MSFPRADKAWAAACFLSLMVSSHICLRGRPWRMVDPAAAGKSDPGRYFPTDEQTPKRTLVRRSAQKIVVEHTEHILLAFGLSSDSVSAGSYFLVRGRACAGTVHLCRGLSYIRRACLLAHCWGAFTHWPRQAVA